MLTFENLRIEILDEYNAFVIGKWSLARESKPISGYYTLLWKKINGKWLIVSDHTS